MIKSIAGLLEAAKQGPEVTLAVACALHMMY